MIETFNNDSMPGLYQAADDASLEAQQTYFFGLLSYLILLVFASFISLYYSSTSVGAIISAFLFLLTLGILIFLRVKRPDDTWYNGRAVAESVKTRSWRWMMRAEPYVDVVQKEIMSKQFINDLKLILQQNRSLSNALGSKKSILDPISDVMNSIRSLPIVDRLEFYKTHRIKNQADWYAKKSIFNKKRANYWFWTSVVLHSIAIIMLLIKIKTPNLSLPIEVIATSASAVLTWLQAKKHNELSSSYSLTAHEITLIKGEALSVESEKDLSNFVNNSEAAFSREHTQWVARKDD